MSNEGDHRGRVIRSVVAGGACLAPTLVGIGAAGLLADWSTNTLACFISFLVGFLQRLTVEYGITVPSPDT